MSLAAVSSTVRFQVSVCVCVFGPVLVLDCGLQEAFCIFPGETIPKDRALKLNDQSKPRIKIEPKTPSPHKVRWQDFASDSTRQVLESLTGWSRPEESTHFLVDMPGEEPPLKIMDSELCLQIVLTCSVV